MDKLEAMRTFVAIVDEGTLTKAARSLNKAQPTVVRSLALLEEDLGVRLLTRTTRKLALTPEGRTYLERCRQILADVGDLESLLKDQSADLRGELRVTAPVLFGTLRVAPLVASFLRRYPRVQVELTLLDRVASLVEEGFDLGVRIAKLEDSSLVAVKVDEVVPTLVASPGFLREVGKLKVPQDVAPLPTVVHRNRPLRFREKGRNVTLSTRPALSTNHAQAGILACESGIGIGQFLSYQVEESLRSGRLVRLLASFEPEPIPVHLVFSQTRLLSARQRVFVDHLKEGLCRNVAQKKKGTPGGD